MYKLIPTPLLQYAVFNGRMTRSQFLRWLGFLLAVYVVSAWLDLRFIAPMLGYLPFEEVEEQYVTMVAALLLAVPYLASNVRRLHDVNRSSWWMLFGIFPILIIYYSGQVARTVYGTLSSLGQKGIVPDAVAGLLVNQLPWVIIILAILSLGPVLVWSLKKGSNEPNRFGTRQ